MRLARPVLLALLASVATPLPATTLDEAIDAAMTHAPQIAAARADAEVASAKVDEAKGNGLPSVTATGTIGWGRLDPQGYFGLSADNVTPRAAQVTLQQPLFAGGRVAAGIAQARAGEEAAQAGEQATRSQMVASVAQAYGDVLTSRRIVALNEGLVAQMQEIERQAQLRFRDGESPSTDVAQAASRLAEAQAAQAQAQGMAVTADARFANLTGLVPGDLQPLPANPAMPATLEDAMDAALTSSPWVAQAEAELHAAEAGARAARGEWLPSVGAFAEGSMVRDQFFPGYRADAATVGVRARWSLGLGTPARVSGANAAIRAAQARLEATRDQLREQVISAYQGVRTAQLVEAASARQAAAAAQARDNVRHEVRVGMKTQLALLDAEREATAAAASEARAQTDRIVAAYRLLALIGR